MPEDITWDIQQVTPYDIPKDNPNEFIRYSVGFHKIFHRISYDIHWEFIGYSKGYSIGIHKIV